MRTIRVEHACDVQPSPADIVTEVVRQNRIVGVERGLGPTRLGA